MRSLGDGHVFISYARQDGREYAERLDNDLASAGFRTWRDTRSINEYQDFSAEIENAIRAASYVAVCVTPSIDANPHSFVRREIIYADSKQKPIIPLVFPNADVPTLVNHLTWIPFCAGKKPGQTLDYDGGLAQLLARVQQAPTPTAQRESSDPYREYLKALYDRIVYYLNQTVFSLITLHSQATPDAVEEIAAQALPMAFFDMAGIGGKTDKKVRFQNFYEAFDKYGGRALLLGEPGAGKTTTLMAFARDAVWKRLENPSLPLPILAPIATWDSQQQTPIAEWLVEAIPALKQAEVERLLAAGRALLILDGLDELGGEREELLADRLHKPFQHFVPDVVTEDETNNMTLVRYDPRKWFMSLVPAGNQVVVTCRVKDYEEIGEKIGLKGAVTLQALDDGQMRDYLREMPDLWAALEADDDLREVARTPLLLSLFTYAFAGLDEEAKKLRDLSRGDLRDKIFETYVRRRYEHEKRKPHANVKASLELIYEVLGYVGMGDVSTRGGNRLTRTLFLYSLGEEERAARFIELAIRIHLLTHGEDNTYRFVHLLLRDYFAFHFAMKELHQAKWHIGTTSYNAPHPVRALGLIGDGRAVEPLIRALSDRDKAVRASAAEALGNIGDVRAIKPLIYAMRSMDRGLRFYATRALKAIGEPAVESLISALKSGDGELRKRAVSALGAIGDKRAIEALVPVLRDADRDIRRIAAGELAVLGDNRAIEPLLELLSDTTTFYTDGGEHAIRMCDFAAQALERIGTPEALEAVARWRREQGEQ